jgi:RimJ/RimL family protein N-acetyltransferase
MSTEENFIDFKCPYCGELISYPQDAVGFARECFNCQESFVVPEAGTEAGKKIPVPISTPKLVLRRFNASDWKSLMELLSDDVFFRFTDGLQGEEEEHVLSWLDSDHLIKLTTPDQTFRLAMELKDGGKLIGFLGLRVADHMQAEFRINLHRNFQRQGFALEAVKAMLGFCFEEIHLHRVYAGCDSRNTPACRLFEKAGLRREAMFLKNNLVNGEWTDTVYYAQLREEHGNADGDRTKS